jgi:hypothetical protein
MSDERTPGADDSQPERDESEDDAGGGLPVSRRALLGAGGVVGAGVLALATLGGEGDVPDPSEAGPGGSEEHLPYDVWDEMRAALRTSPDHLPARAERLVEAGDPIAIEAFVRDEILLLPTNVEEVGSSFDSWAFWGARGTLRGGAGTPRDKAELLAHLLDRAGFDAEVVEARYPPEDTPSLYLRSVDRPFDPDVDESRLDDWASRLGVGAEGGGAARLDPDGVESEALGERLAAALPEGHEAVPEFDWDTGDDVPVVRYTGGPESTADGTGTPSPSGDAEPAVRYANPIDEVDPAEVPISEASPMESRTVSVTLSAATADRPGERFDLVSGDWETTAVVGRQVVVRTLPGIDPFSYPSVRYADVDSFVPSLSVRGMALDSGASADLSVLGDAVTTSGDRLAVEDDGTVTRNGRPIASRESAPAAEGVESVSVTADPSRYPEVGLEVDALDADGDPVEGLPATAFRVTEEGTAAGVSVVASDAAPRVLVLYDTSISMPNEYYGEEMTAFVSELTAEIEAINPEAVVETKSTGSYIWSESADAAADTANVVVYATDGHVQDERTEQRVAALEAGPPFVMLSVDEAGEPSEPIVTEIAELTDGTAVPARDRAVARDAIRSFVADLAPEFPGYTLEYGSTVDGSPGDVHDVRLTVGGATAETTYTVPDVAVRPPKLSTLALTVRSGGRQTTRVLAGYDPEREAGGPTQAHLDEVRGALFGSTVLTFEGMAPTASVWLDEFLGAKSSTRALDAALAADDEAAVERAAETGVDWVPPEAFALTPPLPDAATEDALTYPDGVRVARFTQRLVFGEDHYEQEADILPLTWYGTATRDGDPRTRFERTLGRTARMAVAEAATFDSSTHDLLADARLVDWASVDEDAWGESYDAWEAFVEGNGHWNAEGMGSRFAALVPDDGDGTARAYWSVNRRTGSVLGVMPDGTNGGYSRANVEDSLEAISVVVNSMNLFMTVTGAGGFAVGVVAAYGQVLARLYAAVSLAIAVMDADRLAAAVADARRRLVCEIAKAAFLEAVPLGSHFSAIESLVALSGGNTDLTSC